MGCSVALLVAVLVLLIAIYTIGGPAESGDDRFAYLPEYVSSPRFAGISLGRTSRPTSVLWYFVGDVPGGTQDTKGITINAQRRGTFIGVTMTIQVTASLSDAYFPTLPSSTQGAPP